RAAIDYLTRGTYNLLGSATQEKVARVVYLSTLDLMTPYEASYTVSESWRPLPELGARPLSKHLGEYTCREFAREGKLDIVVLRLGQVVREAEARGKPFDPLWVGARAVI